LVSLKRIGAAFQKVELNRKRMGNGDWLCWAMLVNELRFLIKPVDDLNRTDGVQERQHDDVKEGFVK
jgi:hypothetical protein